MLSKFNVFRLTISLVLILSVCSTAFPVFGQDLVPVSDITGGSSVFVFRNSAKASKKYSSTSRTARTKAQRLESAKRIKTQYETLAKVQPRRARSTVVDPDKLPPSVRTMPKDQASRLFAGVGEYYIDQNDLENSVSFFRESVTLDSKNKKAIDGLSDALAAKGNELLIRDQASTAKAFFLEALKNNPNNAAALFGLGEVYNELDQADLAIVNYEKALLNDKALSEIYLPLGVLYFQKGEIAKADELLTKALAAAPDMAETQLFLGMIRLSQNRNAEALTAFQRAKQLDPENADVYFNSGEAFTRIGRTNEAIADYQKAVSLRPKYFEAWRGLGGAFYDAEKYGDSVAAYKQAARLKNDSGDVFAALGDAHRMTGNFVEAQSNYDLATLFMSRSKDYGKDEIADIYSKIGYVIGRQCEINQKNFVPCQWPAAIKALEKAVELGGGNTADFANLGWAYYNAARIDQYEKRESDRLLKLQSAKINLQKAVAANPPYVEGPLLNLGMTLTDLGDYNGAVDALSKVVKKEPKWVFALNELGIAYRKLDNFKEAISNFKKAIDKDPNFASAVYNLGEAEFRSGNMGGAKQAYQKLVKMGQKNLAAQLELISMGAVKK